MKPTKKAKKPNESALTESVDVACPFCGQVEPVAIDAGGGEHQTVVEDCAVCCKPRVVKVDSVPGSRRPQVRVERA